jgi:hypothetical protein
VDKHSHAQEGLIHLVTNTTTSRIQGALDNPLLHKQKQFEKCILGNREQLISARNLQKLLKNLKPGNPCPKNDQVYLPVSIAAQGCQNVVLCWGGARCEHREK